MNYLSSRGGEQGVSPSLAILRGLAADGGLYLPERLPRLELPLEELAGLSYQETAYQVMKSYFTDFTEEELRSCIDSAYDKKFDTEEIAPVVKRDDVYFLELFHGRTIAFKDMALSILPHLMVTSARKNGVEDRIVILTATSGDTGKAAMAGFQDVPGTEIIVFYPKDGVSRFQELQMRTQQGDNTHVAAIRGNFDDAQSGVKEIFADKSFRSGLKSRGIILSSANSINIGRLVPQIAYYVYAYGQLLSKGEISCGEEINVCVPTGNFGNILAAKLAKEMGLPISRLICASNENRVLTDFFNNGIYDRRRKFILTSSPSMDILISSNLERLIFLSSGCDAERTAALMKELANEGSYSISESMAAYMSDFYGGCAEEQEVFGCIRELKEKTGYVIDPHTAVAKAVYDRYRGESGDRRKTIIASTASPFKFAPAVMEALGEDSGDEDVFELIDRLSRLSSTGEPQAVSEVRGAELRHDTVCEISELKETVASFLSR